MSRAPHAILMRPGVKFGNGTLSDTMLHDGLTDAFNQYHMGVTGRTKYLFRTEAKSRTEPKGLTSLIIAAENIAKKFDISREQQDEHAVQSQARVEAARRDNKFSQEIVPVTIKDRKGNVLFEHDEFPRPETSLASLSKLRPAFSNVSSQESSLSFPNLHLLLKCSVVCVCFDLRLFQVPRKVVLIFEKMISKTKYGN